jgi:glycosyltransferase involved in cell wall biosynthesis
MAIKFKIVIPSYNNENWIEPNLASIINQTYTNYDVLYIDDCSTDETFSQVSQIVGDLPNWRIARNEKNMRRGYNISPYTKHIKDFIQDDENVLVFIDGDDWLYDDTVLEKLNEVYQSKNYWMTYGRMICYPSGEEGNPQNTSYGKEVHDHNLYRRDYWRASHLRTFKWHLYKQIRIESMIYSKTGEYYFHAEDLATSYPCLEMSPESKIGVLNFNSYIFNATPSNRERGAAREAEAGFELEQEIRDQKPYQKLKDE